VLRLGQLRGRAFAGRALGEQVSNALRLDGRRGSEVNAAEACDGDRLGRCQYKGAGAQENQTLTPSIRSLPADAPRFARANAAHALNVAPIGAETFHSGTSYD
jgi:hypothetical protein